MNAAKLIGTCFIAIMWVRARVLGLILTLYMRLCWGAEVGSHLKCFGWPRNLQAFGRVIVGNNVSFGRSIQLNAKRGALLTIGDNASIGDYSTIAAMVSIVIGNNLASAEFVQIRDFDHNTCRLNIRGTPMPDVTAPILIEDDVWIGYSVSVLRGSRIGRGSVVGANAVVKGTFEPRSVVVGVPARRIRTTAVSS